MISNGRFTENKKSLKCPMVMLYQLEEISQGFIKFVNLKSISIQKLNFFTVNFLL